MNTAPTSPAGSWSSAARDRTSSSTSANSPRTAASSTRRLRGGTYEGPAIGSFGGIKRGNRIFGGLENSGTWRTSKRTSCATRARPTPPSASRRRRRRRRSPRPELRRWPARRSPLEADERRLARRAEQQIDRGDVSWGADVGDAAVGAVVPSAPPKSRRRSLFVGGADFGGDLDDEAFAGLAVLHLEGALEGGEGGLALDQVDEGGTRGRRRTARRPPPPAPPDRRGRRRGARRGRRARRRGGRSRRLGARSVRVPRRSAAYLFGQLGDEVRGGEAGAGPGRSRRPACGRRRRRSRAGRRCLASRRAAGRSGSARGRRRPSSGCRRGAARGRRGPRRARP